MTSWWSWPGCPGVRARAPHILHTAAFDPPVEAAVAPLYPQAVSAGYRERYDEGGMLHAPVTPMEEVLADRAAELRALAERLIADQTARIATGPGRPAALRSAGAHDPRQPGPAPTPRPHLP
ncbi:hypothetical protein [Streptomyces sp. NBC_01565]|uniref:hypothetical protein n=1 Tax=Streptomyces sp. NBC_01565 TaxID=2975881 RepID=UPI00225C2FDD|nr:hypothetical protein [Streptomyces sp. NBC_01565]MCX4546458.1 hypothetical protein [Streptomyces sp. NBC_01565]